MLGYNGIYVRQHNRSLVLSMLRNRGPISRRQIIEETGLGSATVTDLVADLLGEGLVEEVGRSPARSLEGGRSRILLDLKPAAAMVAGIHLGVRHIQVAIGDQRGTLHATDSQPRPQGAGPEETVARASRLLDRLLDQVPGARLWGTGVSVPTVVDVDSGHLPHPSDFGWPDGTDLAGYFQDVAWGPVAIGNSHHGLLLAESQFGVARGEKSAILLHPATVVGAAFMVDHKILQPSGDAGSNVGHMRIDPRGPVCDCGARGCLDAIAGDRRVMQQARQRIGHELEPAGLVELAEAGDHVAEAVLSDALRAIAIAATQMILILDIDLLLIAGWLSTSDGKLFERFRQQVLARVERVSGRTPRILRAAGGAMPQRVSAVSLALDRFVYRPPEGANISWTAALWRTLRWNHERS